MAHDAPMSLAPAARFLIVRFGSLGDVVKCTALPRLIKSRYPRGHVTFLTAEPFVELVRDNPFIDRALGFRRKEGLGGLKALAASLQADGVDLVVDVHRSLRSRLLTRWLARPRVQYSKRTLQRWLLIQLGIDTYTPPMGKEVDFLAGLAPYGVTDDGLGTQLFLSQVASDDRLRQRLPTVFGALDGWRRGGKPILGIAPVAAWEMKRWPLAHFRNLAHRFMAATGGGVVVFGGPADTDVETMAQGLGRNAVSLVGRCSQLESAYFASLTDVVVANDTGMTHLAEAAGRDVITLFGPTSRELGYYPTRPGSVAVERDLPCRPCTRMGEGHCTHPLPMACLVGITPEQVFAHVLRQLPHRSP
ncbi:MAG TPA: glycosyltransferase family 9 protein [bacterium]